MSDPGKAVFLSYASQDAEAAKRICEALRATGVEVWLDQSELVGGDAWDTKIRKQIKECALFVPIISPATNARAEGYFRLEWKLAVDRSHLMADDAPFLFPVVIGEVTDATARVPDKFRAVQWTRLRLDETPGELAGRVTRLLNASSLEPRRSLLSGRGEGASAPDRRRKRDGGLPVWARSVVAVLGAVSALLIVIYAVREKGDASPSVKMIPPKLSAARELVAKAWVLLNKTSLAREELDAADDLCRRAADLDPNDAEVWAAWSQVDSWYVYHALERTADRQDGARTKAARALILAPGSYEARLAQACYLVREGGGQLVVYDLDEAERLLHILLRENRDEPRTLEALGVLLRNTKKVTEYRDAFERMAKTTAFAAKAYTELGWAEFFNGNNREAEAAADAGIKLQPYYGNLNLKANILVYWWGDLAQAQATLDRLPAANRLEDYAISWQLEIKYVQRDSDAMLRLLDRFSRDWIESNAYVGPKAWWSGLAHRLAGRDEAGRLQWRTALKIVERRLVDQPDSSFLLRWRARLLAATGQPAEGEAVLRLTRELGHRDSFFSEAFDEILLGHLDAAVAILEERVEAREHMLTAASLRLVPDFDPLRGHPRFQALLARLEADPFFSPQAKPAAAVTAAPASPPGADDKSVAVLAFANLSDDKANEYFSDGISEELLNVLAKVPGLKVTARTSAFHFKGKDTPIPEIAKQLGAARWPVMLHKMGLADDQLK